MKPRRLVFVANSLPLLLTAFEHVLEHLVEAGHEIEILAPDPLGPALPSPRLASCAIRRLPYHRNRPRLFDLLRTALLLARRILRGRRDVFLFLTVTPILLGGITARLLGRRSAYLLTGMGTVFSASSPRWRAVRAVVRPVYRFLFRGARSRVLVQNSDDAAYLVEDLRVLAAHVHRIPGCGAATSHLPYFEQLPANPRPVILVPARLIVEKGILEVVEASGLLRRRGVDHEFWFTSGIDPGNPLPLAAGDLEELARRNPSLRFLGFQESLVPLFEACDVVCLPSYREGLPRALLEAAATGRPMVTTDVVGCREVVEHEVTGLLVPPRDAAALADALERLIRDPELARRLRDAAHAMLLQDFTPQREIRQFLELLGELGLAPETSAT